MSFVLDIGGVALVHLGRPCGTRVIKGGFLDPQTFDLGSLC